MGNDKNNRFSKLFSWNITTRSYRPCWFYFFFTCRTIRVKEYCNSPKMWLQNFNENWLRCILIIQSENHENEKCLILRAPDMWSNTWMNEMIWMKFSIWNYLLKISCLFLFFLIVSLLQLSTFIHRKFYLFVMQNIVKNYSVS